MHMAWVLGSIALWPGQHALAESTQLLQPCQNARFLQIRLDDPAKYQSIVDAEWNIIYQKLDAIAASGAKIVLSRLAIGDLATQYFADRDIFCAGRVCVYASAPLSGCADFTAPAVAPDAMHVAPCISHLIPASTDRSTDRKLTRVSSVGSASPHNSRHRMHCAAFFR